MLSDIQWSLIIHTFLLIVLIVITFTAKVIFFFNPHAAEQEVLSGIFLRDINIFADEGCIARQKKPANFGDHLIIKTEGIRFVSNDGPILLHLYRTIFERKFYIDWEDKQIN